MSFVTDPRTGLQLLELSHVQGLSAPSYPGQEDVKMMHSVKHAQHGVLVWKTNTSLHTSAYMLALIRLIQYGADLAAISPDRFFGSGVVLDVPKGSYETITAQDLKEAGTVREGDIMVINTGWHHKYSDSLEYYDGAPGLTEDAAQRLVERGCRIVSVDTPFADHPLTTSMGPHRDGPQVKRLAGEYEEITGLNPKKEHGKWNIIGRTLLDVGVPLIIQAGGDLDETSGKRATFATTPWKFEYDGIYIVHFAAMVDPDGTCRIDSGKA